MPSGDTVLPAAGPERELRLAALRGMLEATTVQVLRQAARQWGWPLKGTAKDDLVEQMVGYLGDSQRMASAIEKLPEEELAVLSWLAALRSGSELCKQVQAALAASDGSRLSRQAVDAHLQTLTNRCLVFFSEYEGYRLPDIYGEWLPRLAAPKLLYAAPDRLKPPSPLLSVTAITQHAQHLLSALTAEQPPVTMLPKSAPSYVSGKIDSVDPRLPSLVTGEILARWGYSTETEQHLARFLLQQLVIARLCRTSLEGGRRVLCPADPPDTTWEMATAPERLQRLSQTYLTFPQESENRVGFWSEWDVVFPQMQDVNLRPIGSWVTLSQLIHQIHQAGVWLSWLVTRLQADTWYGVEQFCRLIYAVQRDFLNTVSRQTWWQWVVSDQLLNPQQMDFDTWMKTYGLLVQAWLTGPASWLLFVQIGYAGGWPVAFRRPSVLPAGVAEPPPRDALRFMSDGVIGLTNDWRASDLRRLLRLISVEAARDATTTLLRLDADAFRSTLRAGQGAADVAVTFANAGFPLPPMVQETLQTWQSRAGRYQLYDQMTVVEFGEDMLPEELRAISRLSNAEYYQPAPRCLIFLDIQVATVLVDELRRRGYTPQVLS